MKSHHHVDDVPRRDSDMTTVRAISEWLRTLRDFQSRPRWYDDHLGLADLYHRKATLFGRISRTEGLPLDEVARASAMAEEATVNARAHLAEAKTRPRPDVT